MSAYRKQLSDARANTGIRNIAGKCASSDEFADLINRVTERLMKRGSWWGTEVMVRLCTFGCEIVWPKYVATVRGIRTCAGQVDLRNGWYSILGPADCSGDWGGADSGSGAWGGFGYGAYGNVNATAFDNDTSPVQNQISSNTGKLLRYAIVKPQDYGKTITFYGKQYGGQPLQELDSSGNWQMGLTLTAASPIAQTTVLVTRIDQVVREATQGMAYLYEYDSATTLLRTLAVYEPNETNPQYRKSTIQNLGALPYNTDANGVKSWTVEAMVKLEYFPVVNDRDFLLIDDFEAIKLGIEALQFEDARDFQQSEIAWKIAIRELNYESRNRNPGNQFVVKNRVMGSNRVIVNAI